MSELLDKQVNAQKEKTSGVRAGSHKPTKKVAMKMKQRNKKKQHVHKNVIDGRRSFIGCPYKSSMIDCQESPVDDC